MNKLNIIAIATGLLMMLIYACSTDFDITGEWEERTIIYGLLDQSQDTQFVRIERAFLNQAGSAYDYTQVPDSIYYSDIDVQMKVVRPDDGAVSQTITLKRVNADTIGYPKDQGDFVSNPNYLYYFTDSLREDRNYKIEVTTPKGNYTWAETSIVSDFRIFTPEAGDSLGFNFGNDTLTSTRWRQAEGGFVYDVDLFLHYDEVNTLDNSEERKIIKWNMISNRRDPSINNIYEHDIFLTSLFSFIRGQVPVQENVKRYFKFIEMTYSCGTEELYNFQLVNFAQLGVAGGQSVKQYTNVNNGLGLFASRYSKNIEMVDLRLAVQDLLGCGVQTEQLDFAPNPFSSFYPNCP